MTENKISHVKIYKQCSDGDEMHLFPLWAIISDEYPKNSNHHIIVALYEHK